MSKKVKVVATGEEVILNWIGFDLVWIIHDSGEQELVHPSVIGREPRKRWSYIKNPYS